MVYGELKATPCESGMDRWNKFGYIFLRRDTRTNCIILLEKYDALKTLKWMAEHVGEIVQLSHCFFQGRPFKMTVIPSD